MIELKRKSMMQIDKTSVNEETQKTLGMIGLKRKSMKQIDKTSGNEETQNTNAICYNFSVVWKSKSITLCHHIQTFAQTIFKHKYVGVI